MSVMPDPTAPYTVARTARDQAPSSGPTAPPSPLATPIGRRRALAVIGSSVAGMILLDGCGDGAALTPAPSDWVAADVDPTTLEAGQPVPVRFAGSVGGSPVTGSAWLVLQEDGDLVAFDPRCTHAQCAYEPTDDARFSCLCHHAFFDLDGIVLSGPPPRPLDRFAVRVSDGTLELQVPANFSTPRPEA
jgi:nitrite reductase/ring-hydroxylating ferredoxin subunit